MVGKVGYTMCKSCLFRELWDIKFSFVCGGHDTAVGLSNGDGIDGNLHVGGWVIGGEKVTCASCVKYGGRTSAALGSRG